MPVLSPRHSSSLSGSYRSTFSSSSLSRPYYGTTSYSSPRISTTSYSERYSTKTYTTSSTDDKKYSRHSSISDYNSRGGADEHTVRRDSLNGSSRGASICTDRELSLTREPRNNYSSSSTLSMIDSVADLRNKYSPSNYVPAVLRGKDIERSKSINDIGRPPSSTNEKKLQATPTATAKKVTKIVQESATNPTPPTTSLAFTNHTNHKKKEKLDNGDDDDDITNGNNRTSVAEIRKKFDPNFVVTGRKLTTTTSISGLASDKTKNTKLQHKPELLGGNIKCYNKQQQKFKQEQPQPPQPPQQQQNSNENKEEDINDDDDDVDVPRPHNPHNHTTNFASYIPNKEFFELQNNKNSTQDNGTGETATVAPVVTAELIAENATITTTTTTTANNDITTSPRLPRSSISQSSSISNNRSSPSNTRASPAANNRASPSPTSGSATLDTIRARSLAAAANTNEDDVVVVGGRCYEQQRERGGSTGLARSQGLNGLKNIGNTCFMNSVIQCLSNTKYLLEYVREEAYQSDINTSISSMKGALIKAFSLVIQELWSTDSSDKVVNTVALKSQIQRFAPRFMGYAQQDAQEFLRYLLEGLHEDVNRVTSKPKPILTEIEETLSDSQKANEAWSRYLRMDNSRVVDIFVGQLKSTLRCTHCGHCSVTFDPFWDLSLPIPQRSGQLRLGQCLEHFTREETLDGDEKPTCSKCKERRKCTKSFCIQKFPKILVIHLKRFSPTERFRGKLSLVIDFPLQGLDLSAFAASKNQTESMYNLYAISNHSGTTYSGHYTAYCKHPYSGQWHEYNDSRVSSISSKNVVSSEAYVLFYELINQNSNSHL